jgi:uncharacterized phiE125 gp8 family phage protein
MSINYFPEPPIYINAETKLVSKSFASEGAESILLAEIKAHLYIESGNSDFDSLLTTLITQVRQYVEEITCLSLVSKTVTAYFDYYAPFRIPFAPVTSFASADMKTGINTYETKTINTDFEVENGVFSSYFGTFRIKLVYIAGYTSSTIPAGLKLAMLNEIARRFDNRGDGSIPETNDLISSYKMLEWLV